MKLDDYIYTFMNEAAHAFLYIVYIRIHAISFALFKSTINPIKKNLEWSKKLDYTTLKES